MAPSPSRPAPVSLECVRGSADPPMKKSSPSAVKSALRERRAQRGELVEARATNRGRGLFALVDFEPGERVCGMRGDERILSDREVERLIEQTPALADYLGEGPDGSVVVPRIEELGWHLANHSCRPSCALETKTGAGLRARRRIHAGDEITVWYGWTQREVPCLCGEARCSGWIGLPQRKDESGATRFYRDEDIEALVRVAVANDNVAAIETVYKALLGTGAARQQVDACVLDILGPDARSILSRLDRRRLDDRKA